MEVDWDQDATDRYLMAVAEELLPMLADDVAGTARRISPRSSGPRSGRLRASVTTAEGQDSDGAYADVISLWYGRFMDPKARQLHRLHPFLPTALLTEIDGRTYYL